MQLFLVRTQLFRTVLAAQVVVRIFGKALRVSVKGKLPSHKQRHRQEQQAPRIMSGDKKERCEHHGVIPVVDSAGAAAFILQEPALKGAEKKDTDHITDRVSAGEQDHDSVIQDACHVQCAEESVETDPDQSHQHHGVIVVDHNIGAAGFDIVACKLFLAAGALKARGEKAKDHFKHKHIPYHYPY